MNARRLLFMILFSCCFQITKSVETKKVSTKTSGPIKSELIKTALFNVSHTMRYAGLYYFLISHNAPDDFCSVSREWNVAFATIMGALFAKTFKLDVAKHAIMGLWGYTIADFVSCNLPL